MSESEKNTEVKQNYVKAYVSFLATTSTLPAMRTEEIADATSKDPKLQLVIQALQTGQWPDKTGNLKIYKILQDQLTVSKEHLLLRNNRIVIPEQLQEHVVHPAHEGHLGTDGSSGRRHHEKVYSMPKCCAI